MGQCEGAASDDVDLGQQTFSACAACHGLDGRGGEHAPNIATDPNIQRKPDAAILGVIRNGIPAAGMPGFSKLLDDRQIQAVFKYLRKLQRSEDTGQAQGNRVHGAELFFVRAGCAGCHMIDGRGGFFATDLSGYGQGHSAASIREAILEPNKNPDPRHGAVTVTTRGSKHYTGVIRNEDNFSLQIQTADGAFHFFDKSELVRIEHRAGSLMPSDYGSKLTAAELDDLISFLSESKGGAKSGSDDGEE